MTAHQEKYIKHLYILYKKLYQVKDNEYSIPYNVFKIIFKKLGVYIYRLESQDAVGLIIQTKIIMNEYATAILVSQHSDHDEAYTKYIGKK